MSMQPDIFNFSDVPNMDVLEDGLVAFLAVYMIIMAISSLYSIVVYVLHSLGLYTIGKRRLIHHPWLAWIPVANLWLLGSISDHYQYMAKNKKTRRRKILIGLSIALYALLLVIGVVLAVLLSVAVVSGAAENMILPAVILILGYFALLVIAIILTVFQYIAYYDLYASCNPNNAVAFLVLSIFFNFLTPYFVFACRKKDRGMPAPQYAAQAEPQPDGPVYIPAPVSEEPAAVEVEPTDTAIDPCDPVTDDADFETEE